MYFWFCQSYPTDRLTILEKWLKKSRFREITITMTPAAKIRFVKNRIEDQVAISPKGPIAFSISDIYAKTFNIFSDEQYSILLKLEEEGYIKSLVPIAKYKVKFEMTDKPLDPFGIIAMNAAKGKKPARVAIKDTLLMTKNLEPELEVIGLASYSDGTIRYKDVILPLRGQIKDLCRMFMRNPKRLLTRDDIKENIIAADKRKAVSKTTISKYVSELRNSLKVHFKKDVIYSQKDEGWYFDPNKKS